MSCGDPYRAGDFSNTDVQGKLVHDMRYLASVVTQCFSAFGELLGMQVLLCCPTLLSPPGSHTPAMRSHSRLPFPQRCAWLMDTFQTGSHDFPLRIAGYSIVDVNPHVVGISRSERWCADERLQMLQSTV